jgi:hypothetical protein
VAEAEAVAIAELRRRMQGSFSPGELKDLGSSIGLAPTEAWEKGPESAIRDIVRRAHDGPGLAVLLERLKVDRPLVEWPEPPSLRAGLVAPAPSAPASPGEAIPDLDGPTIADPFVPPADLTPPPLPAAGAATAPTTDAPLEAPPPASVGAPPPPSSASPPAASWPMQNLPAPEKKGGLDPRILAVSIAFVALAVVVAFVGGIVFSRRTAPAVIAGTTRTETLAGHAANVMDGAIVEVARGCGLVVEGTPDRSVLKRAQTTCGHPVAAAGRPPAGYDPADIEPPKLDVAPPSPRPKPITGPSEPAAPPTDLCRAGCKTERRTCMTTCGPEPRDASDFDSFQQCQSKCLGGESSCRQRCR